MPRTGTDGKSSAGPGSGAQILTPTASGRVWLSTAGGAELLREPFLLERRHVCLVKAEGQKHQEITLTLSGASREEGAEW